LKINSSEHIEKKKFAYRNILNNILIEYSVWILLIILFIFGGSVSKDFFSFTNMTILLHSGAVLGLLALAETACLLTGNFDLTIEENMIFIALIGGYLISSGPMATGLKLNPALTILIMLLVGGGVGLINGFIVGILGINAFMGTLAMSIMLNGLNNYISPKDYGFRIFPFPESFNFFGGGYIGKLPFAIIGLIIIFIIYHFIFTRTKLGRSLVAVGSNRVAARSFGINDKLIILMAYVISGMTCGLAAWMIMGRMAAATPAMSTGNLFFAFAAAVIGGVSLSGGKGSVLGVFGGFLLIVTINNIMNLYVSAINPYFIELGGGLIILIAVFMDTLRNRFVGIK
jgi:simple sugar transport system permease protein